MTRTGDRPNYLLPNQRFDKGDALRINQLWEETQLRLSGGVFGQAWGCLTAPQLTLRVAAPQVFIDVGPCSLIISKPTDGLNPPDLEDGTHEGQVVIHDPARATQTSSYIDITAFAPTSIGGGGGAGLRCWLLFKREEGPTDLDDKAYWDTGPGAESTSPTNLITQEYVSFAATATVPSASSTYGEANGWFRFAYISSWADPAGPTLVPLHWIHAPYVTTVTPPTSSGTQTALAPTELTAFESGGTRGFSPALGMPSMGRLMHWVLGKLSQHYSTASITQSSGNFTQPSEGDGWMATPPKGLVEVDAALTAATAAIDANTAAIDALRATIGMLHRPLATIYAVRVGSGSYTFNPYMDAAFIVDSGFSWTVLGTVVSGAVNLTFTVTAAAGTTIVAHVAQAMKAQAYVFSSHDEPDLPVMAPSAIYPINGGGVQTFTLRWVDLSGSGTEPDQFNITFFGRRS